MTFPEVGVLGAAWVMIRVLIEAFGDSNPGKAAAGWPCPDENARRLYKKRRQRRLRPGRREALSPTAAPCNPDFRRR